ncbi:hypothetical protein [Agrobacterium tumefaciens]|nr:hypothetical protein [Agrobacterium tumefaciens]
MTETDNRPAIGNISDSILPGFNIRPGVPTWKREQVETREVTI